MELQIVHFLNQLGQGTIVDSLSYSISWIPGLIIFWLLLALIAIIFDSKNGQWLFWGTVFVVLIYFVINDIILKQTLASIFFRERPYLAFPKEIIPIGAQYIDSSMPSGHMAANLGLVTLYLYFYRKWWVWVFSGLFVLLLVFSRLHNGMHYPSDIIVGSALGVGYGFLSILIVNKIRRSK